MSWCKVRNHAGENVCSSCVHFLFTQEILDRTGYSLDVTTGQRKFGGPPPGGDPTPPGPGHEVRITIKANDLYLVPCT